jgi:hypothetical protein
LGDISKSWAGRIASGLLSARPALPNVAGQQNGAAKGGAPQQQQQAPQQQGPFAGVHIENFVQAPNRNSQQVINDLAYQSMGAGGSR